MKLTVIFFRKGVLAVMDLSRNITDASQKIFHLDQHRSHEFEVGDEFSDVTVIVGTSSMRCHKRLL